MLFSQIRMMDFYASTLRTLIASGHLDPRARTLVVAGGTADRDALIANGFTDVVISNLDTRLIGNEFLPYGWAFQDAEALDFTDGSFAQVIEHAGLHHCASPHRALTEMYRVASHTTLAFEARDSTLMRLGVRFGLTTEHEVEAVVAHDFGFGGWRNTSMPNFVYRWTEREVRKTIASYDPSGPADVTFFYGLRLPTERLAYGSPFKRWALEALTIPIRAAFAIFRRQGNEFAFCISKPMASFPWMNTDRTPQRDWLEARYQAPRKKLPVDVN